MKLDIHTEYSFDRRHIVRVREWREYDRKRMLATKQTSKDDGTTTYYEMLIFATLTYFCVSIVTAIVLDALRIRLEVSNANYKLSAVCAELPVLLSVCWRASSWSRRKFKISSKISHHVVMSLSAFALFFTVEMVMMTTIYHLSLTEAISNYPKSFLDNFPANLIGRTGEIAYGAIPTLQVLIEKRKSSRAKQSNAV